MIGVSPEVARRLRQKLMESCFEAGIGFRILTKDNEHGEPTVSIKVDRTKQGDQVLDAGGVKVLVDPANATWAADHSLDYIDEPEVGFVIK